MRHLTKEQLSQIYREVVLSPQRRIVLLDVGVSKRIPVSEENQNVYCIGPMGEVHWQIQADNAINERDSFVSLSIGKDSQIRADRFFGNEFLVNPDSGVAEHIGWHK